MRPKGVATEIADYVRGRILGTAGPAHHQAASPVAVPQSAPAAPPTSPPPPPAQSVEDRLRRLRSMLDEGLIESTEYEAKRAKLIEEL